MAAKPKILLIDDDPDFIKATRMVLESKPYRVLTARNGDEGLATARKEKPDLILLDIIMPTKDGFSTCAQLKKDDALADVPVLMLTSFAQRVGETSLAMRQGLSLEADDYLEKPIAPAELLARVEKHLGRGNK